MTIYTPIDNSIKLVALDLIQIARNNWKGYDDWCESDTGVLSDPKVRQLGEQAHRINGMSGMHDAMRLACFDSSGQVRDQLSSAMLTELNHAWNGIGSWQA